MTHHLPFKVQMYAAARKQYAQHTAERHIIFKFMCNAGCYLVNVFLKYREDDDLFLKNNIGFSSVEIADTHPHYCVLVSVEGKTKLTSVREWNTHPQSRHLVDR